MTRVDRKVFSTAITAKRKLGRLVHNHDRLHNLIESYYNVLDYQDITQHELMLADTPRVEHYYRGIKDHVTSEMTVIDLGTGTGILAAFAAQQRPKHIYALDHCDIIETAARVADANGLGRDIEFVRRKSTEFQPPQRVDMILHEQIGNAVFNEQMFANMIDLRKRALKPGGRVLPNPISMYVEPAELKSDFRIPFIWQQDLYGVDYSSLRDLRDGRQLHTMMPLYAFHYERLLVDPEPVFVADFETIEFEQIPNVLKAQRTITQAGTMDGLCVYFDAEFDSKNVLSNSPMSPATSWQTPMLRLESRTVEPGDVVTIELRVPDFGNPDRWTWDVDLKKANHE
ncbi:class I SAM-dependent methyltransferase [Candidatus Nanopelagicales bacterium]|nr:class I SAM-dependent methyltransferase [Candidatus Nanopelagicales bacterium]